MRLPRFHDKKVTFAGKRKKRKIEFYSEPDVWTEMDTQIYYCTSDIKYTPVDNLEYFPAKEIKGSMDIYIVDNSKKRIVSRLR